MNKHNKAAVLSDEDAERGVIASCYHGGSVSISEAIKVLNKDFFYENDLKKLWELVEKMWEKQSFSRVQWRSTARQAGLENELVACIALEPMRYHLKEHIKIVRNCYYTRQTALYIQHFDDLLAEHKYEDLPELLSLMADKVYSLLKKTRYNANILKAGELIEEFNKETAKRIQIRKDGKLAGYSSGIVEMDDITGGFRSGDYIVIGGQRSMGKTDLALNIAVNLIQNDVGVAFISIEMPSHDIVTRMQSLLTNIFRGKIRDGQLSDQDQERLKHYGEIIAKYPVMVSDLPRVRLTDIRAIIQEAVYKVDAKVAVVDYIGLIDAPKAQNREQEVTQISRGLKAMAREFDIALIALSQLSRKVESRKPPIPVMEDFRDTGNLGQDADVAILISKAYEGKRPIDGSMRIGIDKQRNGRTGTIELIDYNKATGRLGCKNRSALELTDNESFYANNEDEAPF